MEEQKNNGNHTIHNYFAEGSNCQVFNAPISNAVFAMPGSHVTQVAAKNVEEKEKDSLPSAEQMASAVETTMKAGLWWGNTAWSVVFRVMQMMGYKGSITQFIDIVGNLAFSKEFPYKCNMDAISKPLRNGKMSRDLERWQEDGVPQKYIKLASTLKEEFEKG